MAKSISFFPVDLTYEMVGKGKDRKPVVHLWGRTVDGKQICVLDDSFKPYFYVVPKKGKDFKEKLLGTKAMVSDSQVEVIEVEEVKKNYLGEQVSAYKVVASIPKGVPILKDEIKAWEDVASVHEYDILFVRRYSIDKHIVPMTVCKAIGDYVKPEHKEFKVPVFQATSVLSGDGETFEKPRILAFDIETHTDFSRGVTFTDPIIMLAVYGEGVKKVFTWKSFETDKEYIEFVKDEKELLERFREIVVEYAPDIIAGYFSDGFDLPYVRKRADALKVSMPLGLDYSSIRIGRDRNASSSIIGISHIDIYQFIRKTAGLALDSYKLDNVAYALLGEKKVDVDLSSLYEVWNTGGKALEEFCIYNLVDARLVFDLTNKMLASLIEMAKIVGLSIFDVDRMGYSQLVEWYTLRHAFDFGEIAPNKPSSQELGRRRRIHVKGGFVFEPTPGLYKDLVVFDYRSLYPTIISSHNIDPSTLSLGEEKDSVHVVIDENESYWFRKKPQGLVSMLIGNIIEKRTEIKKKLQKAEGVEAAFLDGQQNGLKLLANSFYGYLGFYGARWYSHECAESTTALGRQYIQDVIAKAEKVGLKVVYSDTDSVFLQLGEKKVSDVKAFVSDINRELPGLMELEYEGHYSSGIFVSAKGSESGAKKKYALIDTKGTLTIKGFETVRRNWSPISKEVQEHVLRVVLSEHDAEKAFAYVKQVVEDLRKKRVEVDRVVMSTQLTKDLSLYTARGPHVAVAEEMKRRGMMVSAGTVIKYVVTEGKGVIRDRARLPDDVSKDDYDSSYYINNQVVPAVERIFDVLGFSVEDLKGDGKGKQKTLSGFFG